MQEVTKDYYVLGETFPAPDGSGKMLKVVEYEGARSCIEDCIGAPNGDTKCDTLPMCTQTERADHKSVVFQEVEEEIFPTAPPEYHRPMLYMAIVEAYNSIADQCQEMHKKHEDLSAQLHNMVRVKDAQIKDLYGKTQTYGERCQKLIDANKALELKCTNLEAINEKLYWRCKERGERIAMFVDKSKKALKFAKEVLVINNEMIDGAAPRLLDSWNVLVEARTKTGKIVAGLRKVEKR